MSGVRAGLSGVNQPLYVEFHVLSTSKAAVLPPTVENSSVNIGSYVEFSGFSKHKPPLKKPKTSVTKWFVWLTSTPACRHLPRSIRRGRSSQQKQKTYFNSNSETNEHEPAVCRRYNDNMITGQQDVYEWWGDSRGLKSKWRRNARRPAKFYAWSSLTASINSN